MTTEPAPRKLSFAEIVPKLEPRAFSPDGFQEKWERDSDKGKSKSGKGFERIAASTGGFGLVALTIVLSAMAFKSMTWSSDHMIAGELQLSPSEQGQRDSVADAAEVARTFLAARTIEEKMSLVRDPERVLPRMREYYSRPGVALLEKPVGEFIASLGFEMGDREFTALTFPRHQGGVLTIALEHRFGRYRVDWESFVGYGEMSWERFVRDRPADPVEFRVYVRGLMGGISGGVPVFDLADRSGLYRFRGKLTGATAQEDFDVLVKALKETGRIKRSPGVPAILELSFPAGSDSLTSEVLITRLCQMRWFKIGNGEQSPPGESSPSIQVPDVPGGPQPADETLLFFFDKNS